MQIYNYNKSVNLTVGKVSKRSERCTEIIFKRDVSRIHGRFSRHWYIFRYENERRTLFVADIFTISMQIARHGLRD